MSNVIIPNQKSDLKSLHTRKLIRQTCGVKAPPTFTRGHYTRRAQAKAAANPQGYIPKPTPRELAWYAFRDSCSPPVNADETSLI